MKSLKSISWQVPEETYRQDSALSYSTLAKYERGGYDSLNTLFDRVESPSLLYGSLVDTLVTGTKEEFEERYLVCDFPDISDTIIKIVKDLFFKYSHIYSSILDIPNDNMLEVLNNLAYQNNWKPETRCKVIKEKGEEYYNLLYLSQTKEIVSMKDYEDALAAYDALKNSEATKWYFQPDNPFDGIERHYQLKFKGEYKGIPIRCMFDGLIVNHEEGTIQPYDLKTTKNVIEFEDSFYKWKYFIQAQMYAEILKQNIAKDEYFSKFKILEYKFIAIDRKLMPIVFNFPNTFGKVPLYYKGTWYRNWRKGIVELNWHLTHPEVKMPYKMYVDYINNNGVLNLVKYMNGYLENDYTEPNIPEDQIEWKDVVGYEGYYKISNTGKVLRLERKVWNTKNNSYSTYPEKLLKQETAVSGTSDGFYQVVTLTKNNETKRCFVHRLVAEAFIENPNNYTVVNHIDENPLNNIVENLEWCTPEYNTNYGNRNTKVSIQLGVAVEQYDLEGNLLNTFRSAAEACEKLGLPANRQSNISAVCRGVRKSSLGYIWKFKDGERNNKQS